jgi:hypothetical protein
MIPNETMTWAGPLPPDYTDPADPPESISRTQAGGT